MLLFTVGHLVDLAVQKPLSVLGWTSFEERRLRRLSVMHKIHIKVAVEYLTPKIPV